MLLGIDPSQSMGLFRFDRIRPLEIFPTQNFPKPSGCRGWALPVFCGGLRERTAGCGLKIFDASDETLWIRAKI